MTPLWLLLALLVLAFVGGRGSHGDRRLRLPSGGESLLLGIAVGPELLGLVERPTLEVFQPLEVVGTAWLALVAGAELGFAGERRVGRRGAAAGFAVAALSAAGTYLLAAPALARIAGLPVGDARFAAAAMAVAAAETTRHAVRWALGTASPRGPLGRFVEDVAEADDAFALLALAVVSALLGAGAVQGIPAPALAAAPLLLGAAIGVAAAALLRGEAEVEDGRGVILGALLLAAGLAEWVRVPAAPATFVLGATLVRLSGHGPALRRQLAESELPVLSPVLLLAGASLSVASPLVVAVLLVAGLLGPLVPRLVLARLAAGRLGGAAAAAGPLALGLIPAGAVAVVVAFGLSRRAPGPLGDALLTAVVLLVLAGEALGPAALRRAFALAGEGPPPAAAEPAPGSA